MSPEAVNNKPVGTAGDLFALGKYNELNQNREYYLPSISWYSSF